LENYDNVIWTNNSKVVTFPGGTNLLTDKVRPGYYIRDDDAGGNSYLIESVDSATQLTISVVYPDVNFTGASSIICYATFTLSSKVVTFPAGVTLLSDGVLSGMSLLANSDSSPTFLIESVDSETQLTLKDIFPDATGLYYLEIYESVNPYNIAADFTILDSAADFAIDAPSGYTDLLIERIKFDTCAGLARAYATTRKNFFRECIFKDCTGPTLLDLVGYKVLDNYCNEYVANVVFLKLYDGMLVSGNRINFGSFAGSTVFDIAGGYGVISNNFFAAFAVFDAASVQHFGWVFRDNYFYAISTVDIDFIHELCQLGGNRFYTSGAYRFIFSVDTVKNTFIGNWLSFAPTDSGTGNIIANNAVGV